MPDLRKLVNAQMAALIDGTFGCLDAAAETINARTHGHVSKGTLSKRLSGQLGWPVEDVAALEDAAGRYPVSRMLARRMNAGEAISAALTAAQSADGDLTQAIREANEAEAAMRRLREALEAAQ